MYLFFCFFFSSRRRHTRYIGDWSSDVCSSDLPFLDFLTVYGSPASGAAWIVPKAYYEKVGKDSFKQAPIGAGPYRFVKQTPGNEVEFEANPDYWRKSPSIKSLVIRAVPEQPTRAALIKTGEVDVAI